ncbi:MAG: hypothetical protein NDJ89_11445 [Oligoflexia bacterium]|nr:hypothetical protein [Oligoflexia bacterium]
MGRQKSGAVPDGAASAIPVTAVFVAAFDAEGQNAPGARALLDRMIEAMGLAPEEFRICGPDELAGLAPRLVVALGEAAARILLGTDRPLGELRGSFHDFHGTKLLVTFHPATLLENPAAKRDAWTDLQRAAKELGIAIPQKKQEKP